MVFSISKPIQYLKKQRSPNSVLKSGLSQVWSWRWVSEERHLVWVVGFLGLVFEELVEVWAFCENGV